MSRLFVCGLLLAIALPAGAKDVAVSAGPITALDKLESVQQINAQDPARRHVDIQRWETANGARVLFVATSELPMVDVRLVFDAGSARDGDKAGLASTVNSMLDEGTAQYGVDEIAQRFESLGADYGQSSYRDMAIVELRSLADPAYLQPAAELVAELLGQSTFPLDNYQRIRAQQTIGQQQRQQSPGALASMVFWQQLYGSHPYGPPPTGTQETLKRISREDLVAFHQRHYVARNCVIALVGALTPAQAHALAETLSAGMAAGEAAAPLPSVPARQKSERVHREYGSQQTHILLGQPGIRRDDPDYFPLYVGNEILGGSGLTSVLSREIRDQRGLSYSVGSGFTGMRAEGPFLINMQTRNDQVDQALAVTRDVLRDFIRRGPEDAQVQEAINSIVGSFPLGTASNASIVGHLGSIGFYSLPLDYLDTFVAQIRAVTPTQVREAFRRRVDPDKLLVVTVGKNGHANGGKKP